MNNPQVLLGWINLWDLPAQLMVPVRSDTSVTAGEMKKVEMKIEPDGFSIHPLQQDPPSPLVHWFPWKYPKHNSAWCLCQSSELIRIFDP